VEAVLGRTKRARQRGAAAKSARWLLVGLVIAVAGFGMRPHAADQPLAEDAHGGRELLFAMPDGQYLRIDLLSADTGTEAEAAALARFSERVLASSPGLSLVPEGAPVVDSARGGYWWPSRSATWKYNPAGKPAGMSGEGAALSTAAETWNGAGAQFAFVYGGENSAGTGACGSGGDGQNTIGWAPLSGGLLAVTCSLFRPDGAAMGAATEFDMQIDPEWPWTTDGSPNMDLRSVVTHEFGHALGLSHSAERAAVMFSDYTTGTLKRTLAADDIDGLVGLYGRGALAASSRSLALSAGANLVAWPGRTAPPEDTLSGSQIVAVYAYDSQTQTWLRYLSDQPAYLNTLKTLVEGQAYWFVSARTASVAVQ
jgi:hypothetical protein